jgi:hypothetical protein
MGWPRRNPSDVLSDANNPFDDGLVESSSFELLPSVAAAVNNR